MLFLMSIGKESVFSLDLNVFFANDKLFLMSTPSMTVHPHFKHWVFLSFGAATEKKSPGWENSSSAGNPELQFVGKWSKYSRQFVIDE